MIFKCPQSKVMVLGLQTPNQLVFWVTEQVVVDNPFWWAPLWQSLAQPVSYFCQSSALLGSEPGSLGLLLACFLSVSLGLKSYVLLVQENQKVPLSWCHYHVVWVRFGETLFHSAWRFGSLPCLLSSQLVTIKWRLCINVLFNLSFLKAGWFWLRDTQPRSLKSRLLYLSNL